MQNNSKEPVFASSITLRDIAEKLNISHSTVSRALQNASKISFARRKQVQEFARKMGYRPNAMATRLGHQRHAHDKQTISSEIAWLNYWPAPAALRSFREFDAYWRGASQRAEESGYRLEEFIVSGDLTPKRLETILRTRNIHGILLPPASGGSLPESSESFRWENFCLVRFGYSLPFPKAHVVTSNHFACGMLAINNMLRLGYRRVGFVATQDHHFHFRAGYSLVQTAQSRRQPPAFVFPSREDPVPRIPEFSRWIKKHRLDAILTDFAGTRDILKRLGYRVPQDIGLAATSVLDGNADAGIDQHSEEIGRAAMETLLSLLNHNQAGIPTIFREVVITGSWVDGKSLPPRDASTD